MAESDDTPPPPKRIMQLRDVRKTYLSGEVETKVLHGVDLDIGESEFLAILGESGSGKTTLMNLIGGIDRATSGSILFDGEELTEFSEGELTLFRRRQVGFVFQLYNLVPTLTAVENVAAAAELSEDPMDPAHALELVGLGERAGHFPSQLSGGEQQRVAIARALAKRPGLLLCDEPTGALDLETSISVLGLLQRLNRETGTTMIMITHSRAITPVCHRVVTVVDGRIAHEQVNAQPIDAAELVKPAGKTF
jgi:putative ABC transport system ATP-binding protein